MANSVITKTALAQALKELMSEKPFSKISVSEIAEKCRINRKSFYYHFNDKYDLINWIFESEFLEKIKASGSYLRFDFIDDLCRYLYENKDFYRKVIKLDENGSFFEHFRQLMIPAAKEKLMKVMGMSEMNDMYAGLSADILVCTIRRWLMEKNCIEPEKFVRSLKEGALRAASFITGENSAVRS
ncbi:MAG: TetR family transcriptional regulator [Clostridia bacterium]|nr:TetR family transcriptional regulator [Clostridia bacterium]MBQ7087032.1 TetR family transcriptional regulator [Clostridia bacterium]